MKHLSSFRLIPPSQSSFAWHLRPFRSARPLFLQILPAGLSCDDPFTLPSNAVVTSVRLDAHRGATRTVSFLSFSPSLSLSFVNRTSNLLVRPYLNIWHGERRSPHQSQSYNTVFLGPFLGIKDRQLILSIPFPDDDECALLCSDGTQYPVFIIEDHESEYLNDVTMSCHFYGLAKLLVPGDNTEASKNWYLHSS